MFDERKIKTIFEAEVTNVDPSTELWGKIRNETEGSRRRFLDWQCWLGARSVVAGIAALGAALFVLVNFWPARPIWAASLTLSPRDAASLLALGTKEPAGAAELPIQADSYNALYYRWSPDGRYLVSGKEGDLFLYDATTGDTRNLTNTPDRWELMPSWSPHGDRIAFVSRPLEPSEGKPSKPGAGTWVMQGCFCGSPTIIGRDGSGYRLVEKGNSSTPPSWSPNGTILAYELQGRVHLYNLAKRQVSVLQPAAYGLDAEFVGAPSWSPNRNELAVFVSQSEKQPTREEILAKTAARPKQGYALLDLDRNQAQILYSYEAPFTPRPPALWSSEGTKLALLFKPELLVAEPTGLVVVDRESRKSWVVAENAHQAAWEPGGNRLAYLDANDPRKIKVLSPADETWVARILEFTEFLQGFAWRPEGRDRTQGSLYQQ